MTRLFIIAGVVFIALSLYRLMTAILLTISCREEATGTLSYLDTSLDVSATEKKIRECYSPVYEFTVGEVKYYAKAKEFNNNPDRFKIGSTATVKFNPMNPKENYVNGKAGDYYLIFMFAVIGIILVILGK